MRITNRKRNLLSHRRSVALATALLLPLGAVACASDSTIGTADVGDPSPVTTTTPLATTPAPGHDSTSVVDQGAPLTQDELAVPAQLDDISIAHFAAIHVRLALFVPGFGALAAGAATGSKALAVGIVTIHFGYFTNGIIPLRVTRVTERSQLLP